MPVTRSQLHNEYFKNENSSITPFLIENTHFVGVFD